MISLINGVILWKKGLTTNSKINLYTYFVWVGGYQFEPAHRHESVYLCCKGMSLATGYITTRKKM